MRDSLDNCALVLGGLLLAVFLTVSPLIGNAQQADLLEEEPVVFEKYSELEGFGPYKGMLCTDSKDELAMCLLFYVNERKFTAITSIDNTNLEASEALVYEMYEYFDAKQASEQVPLSTPFEAELDAAI